MSNKKYSKNTDTYSEEAPVKKKKRAKKKKKVNPIKKTFAVIGTTLLSLILIVLITGSILAAALTVYVVQFVENTTIDINLDDLDAAYTSFIYAYDDNGEAVVLETLSRNADRIPVEIDVIPQHVLDAFVYTEDTRFYEHAGVDWKRTFGAFINELISIWTTRQGGSTITQQLVKNVTGDDQAKWDRKMREIIRAGQLEQYCTKEQILEAYLNYIGFGGKTAGIEAASQKYFGKPVGELTIAEGACLAGIPKSPEYYNPWANEDKCLERQKIVLSNMLDYGAISEKQYNEAINTEIKFRSRDDVSNEYSANDNGIQNWFVDLVIDDVVHEFMDVYGIEYKEASDKLYNGGYKIYTTCDIDMQLEVEKKYQNYKTFSTTVVNNPPKSAFIAMDYNGNILAVAGDVGEKAGANILNYATMDKQQPGSCIKPISTFSYGIEHDLINWSTVFVNDPIEIEDEHNPGQMRKWPTNYSTETDENGWDSKNYFTFEALERSLNTVPAQLAQLEGTENLLSFIQNKFQITTLNAYDANLAPMAVGALNEGLYLRELVAAYQPFGNLGTYYAPTSYYRVEGPDGELVLDHSYTPIQSISPDTAYIMNKMMQVVITGEHGSGAAARLETKPLAGKTGTTQNWADLLFVGCTPDYVSGVWYGYDNNDSVGTETYFSAPQVWKNVFGDIAEAGEKSDFPECSAVDEYYYCKKSGLAAHDGCKEKAVGYYKSSNPPLTCDQCKVYTSSTETSRETENEENEEE
ncbi:MAG: transglycosylase domain-containing protein [Oscillospiraceae bacterium]|nr:transglycosylase domain-containing protein [Oscillospiraceae bacterium]